MDNKVALVTLRRMIDERFYGDDYILQWIDNVLAGKQDPRKSMTPAVEKQFKNMTAD